MATDKAISNERGLQEHEQNDYDPAALLVQAQASEAADRKLTIWQALRKYKKAVLWSMLLSTALIMEGYDVVIVCNVVLVYL